jgi:hypothetical protein
MPSWLVRATWTEDETEATEQWEVNADTAEDALREVTPHLRFPAHHIELKLCSLDHSKQTHKVEIGAVRAHHIPTR